MALLDLRTGYSRSERISDAVVHAAGLGLALIAVPSLITATALIRGDATAVFAISVYGVALIAMLTSSALYNMIPHPEWEGFLKRLDHSVIYIKIAATYTPLTLLTGEAGWLLATVWGAAALGIMIKISGPDRFRIFCLALYILMGWAGLLAGPGFFAGLSYGVIALIFLGGVLYTVGVLFYLWERLPFHYTIWHAFVVGGSLVFYVAVTLHMVDHAA